MKYSELPQEYRDLEIPEEAMDYFYSDNILEKLYWDKTNEGRNFWYSCHISKTIDELPPIPNKEFILPKKWCIKSKQDSDVHKWFEKKLNRGVFSDQVNYFHYPEYEKRCCTTHYIKKGYTEITYDQWVKYVRDAEYKENALRKNNNLENIKEIMDVVNDKEIVSQRDTNVPLSNQETLEPFYMIYIDGATGSTKKHDLNSAITEAQRLSKETDKKVFILRSEYCFERKIDINLLPIKKD